MNRQRLDTLSSLLLLLIIVVSVVGIGRYYIATREIDQIKAEDERRVIGSDKTLLETVQNLENTLSERISYQFNSKEDPLDLTKVITSQAFLQKLGADKKDPDAYVMRLAATVVGEDGSAAAVIRYLGSGHILRVGDELEGWTVREIGKEQVTLARGGQRKVLENRPIRETLQATGMMLSVRPMRSDDWQTIYNNVGFPGDVNPTLGEPVGGEEEASEEMEEPAAASHEATADMDTTETPADTTGPGGNR